MIRKILNLCIQLQKIMRKISQYLLAQTTLKNVILLFACITYLKVKFIALSFQAQHYTLVYDSQNYHQNMDVLARSSQSHP